MLHGKPEKDWAQSAVFYQIYPMGFCGAPFENDGVQVNRIQKVKEWIPPSGKAGNWSRCTFPRLFEVRYPRLWTPGTSKKIDCRLGSNQEFQEVCARPSPSGASGWCWTGCSTTWAGASGPSRT